MQEIFSAEIAPRAKRIRDVVVGVFVIGIILVGTFLFLSHRESWRNAERLRDIQAITTALHQYAALHGGVLPAGIDMREKEIGTAADGCGVQTAQCSMPATSACLDITPALAPFLKDMPRDPGGGSEARTRYAVRLERSGSFVVIACDYSE